MALLWFWESKVTRSNRVVLKMGQKVHPYFLRLGKRLNWFSIWNTSKTNVSKIIKHSLTRHVFISKLFSTLKFNTNNIKCSYSNKNNTTFIKILKPVKFFKTLFFTGYNYYNTKHINNFNNKDFSTTNSFLWSLKPYKKQDSYKIPSFLMIPNINAQTLALIISKQIGLSYNLKHNSFKQSLITGLTKLASFVFRNNLMSNCLLISGIKIVCKGKWKQTFSGRKETQRFVFGSIKTQSLNVYLSFGSSTITTKFGCCNIKVWISYKVID